MPADCLPPLSDSTPDLQPLTVLVVEIEPGAGARLAALLADQHPRVEVRRASLADPIPHSPIGAAIVIALGPTDRTPEVLRLLRAQQEVPVAVVSAGGCCCLDQPDLDRFGLRPRERQVLEALLDGRTNREIAELLHLGEETVKTYLRGVYRALGARDRSHAIALALRRH